MPTHPITRIPDVRPKAVSDGRTYNHCECDKYSLLIPSFKEWTKMVRYEWWEVESFDSKQYAFLWRRYIAFEALIRRTKDSQQILGRHRF